MLNTCIKSGLGDFVTEKVILKKKSDDFSFPSALLDHLRDSPFRYL